MSKKIEGVIKPRAQNGRGTPGVLRSAKDYDCVRAGASPAASLHVQSEFR